MNSDGRAGELRVFSGLHAGASAVLPQAGTALSLGSDAQNDVMLRDAPFQRATLTEADGAWIWADGGEGQALRIGQGLHIGGLTLVLALGDASWAEPAPADLVQARVRHQVAAPEAAEPTRESAQTDAPGQAPEGAPMAEPRAVQAVANTALWWQRCGGWRVALLALLIGVGAATVGLRQAPAARAALPRALVPLAPTTAAVAQAVADALAKAGFGGAVRVTPRGDGRVQLMGVVDGDEDIETVVRAAAAVTQKLALAVLTQPELGVRLDGLQAQWPTGVSASALPGGRVALGGAAEEPTAIALARQLIARELPEANGVDIEVLAALPTAPAAANPAAAIDRPATIKLPAVAAVFSGPHSYVLLADGSRILPGGKVDQNKLVAIEDKALIFEDKAGHMYRMAR